MSGPPPRPYLADLASRATAGLESLPARFRARQARFVAGAQQPDGGFPGRNRESDLYYTSFALRSADLLNITDNDVWRHAADYLQSLTLPPADVVECFSMVHSLHLVGAHLTPPGDPDADQALTNRAEAVLQQCHVAGSGVARTPGGAASLYHTFLAALCHELLGGAMPRQSQAADFVRACRCRDGGFTDQPSAPSMEGGTNPTAAAIAFLASCGALDESVASEAARFVLAMQREDGGFAAHRAAPTSDLMSTFTSLVTLAELGAGRRVHLAQVARYIRNLLASGGGFRATAGDDTPDQEYTYYGLAALGLLSCERTSGACGTRPREMSSP